MSYVDHSRNASHLATIDGETYDGIVLGIVQTCENGVLTIAEVGTTKITLVGTLSGTLVNETKATDGDEEETTIYVLGILETQEIGTKTGEDQLDGTETDDGTETNELTGTVTIAVLGTETITLDGTEFGTAVHSTITADGDEAMVITSDDGKFETHEIGKMTAELEAHELGITIVAGT